MGETFTVKVSPSFLVVDRGSGAGNFPGLALREGGQWVMAKRSRLGVDGTRALPGEMRFF